MLRIEEVRRLPLISNSTLHGSGYLDHAETEIRTFLANSARVVFIPFAAHDLALKDVAAAVVVYEKASRGKGPQSGFSATLHLRRVAADDLVL